MDAEIRCVRCRVVFSSTDVVIGLDSSVTPDIASGNRKLEIHMDGYAVTQALTKACNFSSTFPQRCALIAILCNVAKSMMELITKTLLVAVVVLAGVLLFTPYEAVLEGIIAVVMVTAVLAGFLMHPRREVFYVRTALPVIDPDRNKFLEHDLLAVRVELVSSRVPSSRPLCGGFDLPLVFIDPRLRELIELV